MQRRDLKEKKGLIASEKGTRFPFLKLKKKKAKMYIKQVDNILSRFNIDLTIFI